MVENKKRRGALMLSIDNKKQKNDFPNSKALRLHVTYFVYHFQSPFHLNRQEIISC